MTRRRTLFIANLGLLVVWPIAWWAPLARAGFLPFFQGEAVSVLGGLSALWEADVVLALLVALFAVILPLAKTAGLALLLAGRLGPRAEAPIALLGKLSMAEVFLVALYIVVVKGTGLGHVTPAWGLWLFTACVLTQIAIAELATRENLHD
ncbi:MAG: paraquat-inducible protein A [Pseudomonadota bacterium]